MAPVPCVPVIRQSWREVTFVNWRYDRSAIQALTPPGLVIDEFDGSAWLTLVALRLTGARLPGMPPVPFLSSFASTNVRTYVRGPDGVPGIWLFSVDAGRLWITAVARLRHRFSHEPWPPRTASLVSLTETLTTAAGLPAPAGDPNVRYSDGVTGATMSLPHLVKDERPARGSLG